MTLIPPLLYGISNKCEVSARLFGGMQDYLMADSKHRPTADRPATYRITVQGRLDESWSDWFNGMTIAVMNEDDPLPITTLIGRIIDQAALRGILTKIWDLGLTLISATRTRSGDGQ